jgi:hypothetical protein
LRQLSMRHPRRRVYTVIKRWLRDDGGRNPDSDANPNSDSHADTDPNADSDAHTDSDTHADSDTQATFRHALTKQLGSSGSWPRRSGWLEIEDAPFQPLKRLIDVSRLPRRHALPDFSARDDP